MIKALGRTGDGRPLLILGLSGESVTRLMADEPIAFDLAVMGLPACQLGIVGGRSEYAIMDQLRDVGLVAD